MSNRVFSPKYKAIMAVFLVILAVFIYLVHDTMYKQNNSSYILEYHNITSDPALIDPWTVNVNDFDQQMAYLHRDCNVVPLKMLLGDLRNGQPIPPRTVAVTFDDGYQSNLSLAYPVLEKYRIPATVFAVTKYAQDGNGGEYTALNWAELKGMSASGLIEVESHTHDLHHKVADNQGQLQPASLTRIATVHGYETEEQYRQRILSDLLLSRQEIQDNLGIASDILSWPYGAYNKEINAIGRQAGFTYIVGPVGYTYPSTDIEEIGRIVIPGGADLAAFDQLVNRRHVNYYQAVPLTFKKIKIQLSQMI